MTKEEQLRNLKSHVEFLELCVLEFTATIYSKMEQRKRVLTSLGEVITEIEKLERVGQTSILYCRKCRMPRG